VTLGVPGALWGLLAIPFIVLLYLLRVRRREQFVSSVLLWQRSTPTLAAYRPTRRVERSLLLLLQIAAVAILVAALAHPSVIVQGLAPGDLMLVLDLSLSMRARDVPPTRFDRARGEALDVAAHLRPGQRAGIVIAGSQPAILVPLTADRARLAAALRAAAPWDAVGDIAGAVALAAGQPLGADGRIIVWTDGAHAELPTVPAVSYRMLGTSDDNVGITAFRATRDLDGAEALLRVDNFGARDRRVPIEVSHLQQTVYRDTIDLPPGGHRTLVGGSSSPSGPAAGRQRGFDRDRSIAPTFRPPGERGQPISGAAAAHSACRQGHGNTGPRSCDLGRLRRGHP